MIVLQLEILISNPGFTTLDNVLLTSGVSSILVWQQSNEVENGVYMYNGSSSPLTRRADWVVGADASLWTIYVLGGTANGKGTYTCTQDVAVIGTNTIHFTIFFKQ